MNADVAIAVLSVIMSVLGVALTLVTGYVAYLTGTLEGRLRSALQSVSEERHDELRDLVEARLSLVDVAVEALCAGGTTGEVDGIQAELYFLQHIGRLASDDADEINKAIGALEAGGKATQHLLPLVERVRAKSAWPSESNRRFEALLRKIRVDSRESVRKKE